MLHFLRIIDILTGKHIHIAVFMTKIYLNLPKFWDNKYIVQYESKDAQQNCILKRK